MRVPGETLGPGRPRDSALNGGIGRTRPSQTARRRRAPAEPAIRKAAPPPDLEGIRAVIEAAIDPIVVLDHDGRCVNANPAAVDLLGASRRHLLGTQFSEYLDPREDSAAGWRTLLEKRRYHGEIGLARPDGTSVVVEVSAVADHPSRRRYLLLRDVTDQKRSRSALENRAHQQAAVALLGQIALAGADRAALMDEAARQSASQLRVEFSTIHELSADGARFLATAGVGWKEGVLGYHAVPAVPEFQPGYTLLRGAPVLIEDFRGEDRFTASGFLGEHGVASGMSVPIRAGDRSFGVLAVYSSAPRTFDRDDVNFLQSVANVLAAAIERHHAEEGLRASEERYRVLFESSPLPMWVYDRETLRFLAVNETAVRQYGYSREEFLSMTIKEIRPQEELPALMEVLRLDRHGSMRIPGTWRHRKKDGTIIHAEIMTHPLDFEGRPAELVLVRDVTERLELERRLTQSERLASIGRLSAYVAHEINTPLANISLLTTSIARRVQDEEVLRKLEEINVQRRDAANIVGDLLRFSKEREVHVEDVDLWDIVDLAAEATDSFRRENVSFDEAGPRPAPASVDPAQMREVVVNLLRNAYEATATGSVGVRIDPRPDAVVLAVTDTGTGIPPDIIPHIFEPFYTTKQLGVGTGLGLPLCEVIVGKHGGRIEVASELGSGTEFRVVLPRKESR